MPQPVRLPWRVPLAVAAVVVTAAVIWQFAGSVELSLPFGSVQPRDGVEVIAFPQGQPLTSLEGDFQYVLSEREIQDILDRIRTYFNTNQDNLVRREVNRILLSTATSPVKERVRILQSSLVSPDFTNLDTSFSYQDVHQNLALYRNTYVRWKGRPTNIVQTEDGVQFTLLVGYHTGQVLEGSVPVEVPFAARVRSDMGIELIGRVVPIDAEEHPSGSPFYLKATTVRMFSLE